MRSAAHLSSPVYGGGVVLSLAKGDGAGGADVIFAFIVEKVGWILRSIRRSERRLHCLRGMKPQGPELLRMILTRCTGEIW